MMQPDFDLTDHDARRVRAIDFRGRCMLVYFGFTHCRVVCPRALARWSSVLDQLGAQARQVAALYITVDPARDTPDVMKAYLRPAYPHFTGLTGSEQQIALAKRSFRVFAERKADPTEADGYVVPHTAIVYLIGPHGEYLTHFTDAVDAATAQSRLHALLDRHQPSFPGTP